VTVLSDALLRKSWDRQIIVRVEDEDITPFADEVLFQSNLLSEGSRQSAEIETIIDRVSKFLDILRIIQNILYMAPKQRSLI
jgi:hypothetical protein